MPERMHPFAVIEKKLVSELCSSTSHMLLGDFDGRHKRSIHGSSAHYGSAWFFSRKGSLFGDPRRKRESGSHLREEIALETLQGWPDRHNAGQERCKHPYAFP